MAGTHATVAEVQVDGSVVDVCAIDQARAQALLLEYGAGALCIAPRTKYSFDITMLFMVCQVATECVCTILTAWP